MIDPRLAQQLEKVAVRLRRLRFWRGLASAWLVAVAAGLTMLGLDRAIDWFPPHSPTIVFGLAACAAAVFGWLAHASHRDYHRVAEQVEAAYPELKSCLLAALEQRPTLAGRRFGFLQDQVIRQALNHAYGHDWPMIVPASRIAGAVLANAAAFVLLLFVVAGLASPTVSRRPAAASLAGRQPSPTDRLAVTVEPGNTEVERGTSLLVLARFQGPQPAEATLVYKTTDTEPERLNMAKSLDDPVFGGRIPLVDQPLDYHVEMPDFTSESYHVSVFEYPRLVRADARLVYPDYTDMPERLVQDVRTISVVEGTELTLICHLNKPVVSATLADDGSPALELAVADNDQTARQTTFRCEKSRKLRLELVDDQGRRNKSRVELTIHVLPNKPPDLKLAFPAHDVEVSPLEETDVKATAWDDFGLRRIGLTYELAGGQPVEVVLGENATAKERHELTHVIRLEELKAEPDQLLSYHFWAEDAGPDGQPRRTESDMYFAEVRPFDEIFRQGQQPPGGSQQQQQQGGDNAQAAEKLLKLQKDIVNATWKVIRRELPDEPSTALRTDVKSIGESQSAALAEAKDLAQKLTDPQSQAHLAEVTEAMQQAIDKLQAAHDGNAVAPLRPALSAEQAAYPALLKLRAREHSVIRRRQQGGGGGGGGANRSQQQLQQLELKNDENRYETQRTAQSQAPEQRETRQVLNRLSELARRQNDLNERLKELQSALEEAQSEPDREEIRRQLKRLREEEEEILRDTDELKARMDQPENQERMAEAREQLDQTRDQVRRASESLADEKVSQAAAAGTRAQRDFQELRNEFRRRASGQFSDQMREMRDDARQLDQKEREIAERLAKDGNEPAEKSLRGDDPRDKVPEELAQQKERLSELLNRMRETIEEAETPEPLLAEQLYDTARKIQEQNLDRALEAAENSLRRGLTDDARGQERIAGKGINELREGIEHAADSVLGDDTEALRRAREELDRLSDELGDEIARNTGEGFRGQGSGFREEDAEPGDHRSPHRVPSGWREESRSPSGDGQSTHTDQSNQNRPDQPQSEGSQTSQGRSNDGKPPNGRNSRQAGQERNEGAQPNDRQPSQFGGEQSGSPRGGEGNTDGAQRLTGGSNVSSGAGGGFDHLFDAGNRTRAPITGEDFRDWSDRLRDVEEMIDDPELRAEAARIRERARGIRGELKRHSQPPNWDLVKIDVSRPLQELRDRVAEELLRRTSQDALLPLDRDPVPPKYSEKTRRYYERLGSGR
jgi:hypothetical protein